MGKTGTSMNLKNMCGSAKLRALKKDSFKQKFCYDNLLDALHAARRSELWLPQYRWGIYLCEMCGFIHVGRVHPKAILYSDDMALPSLPGEPRHRSTQKSAISKQEKRRIMERHKVTPAKGCGLDKAPKVDHYKSALEYSSARRGYMPFENLKDMFGGGMY